MTTKLGRVLTYLEVFPPMKSHDFYVTCSCEIIWQNRNIAVMPMAIKHGRVATYSEELQPKHGKVVTYRERLLPRKSNGPFKQVTLWGHGTNWIHIFTCRRPYEHQTREGGVLTWHAVTLKVTLIFDHVNSMWSPDNLKSFYLLALKFGRVLTSGKRLRTRTQERKLF